MEEKKIQYKRKIRKIGILLLVLLLLLTFFSGTIRNFSLAQVKTALAGRGTISRKVNASGVLEAGQPVMVLSPREGYIEKINVLEGQHIKNGDLLFSLAPEKNEDYVIAKEELETMMWEYDTFMLEQSISTEKQNQVEAGQIATLEQGREILNVAQENIEILQAQVDIFMQKEEEAKKNNELLGNVRLDVSKEQAAYNDAQRAYEDAQAAFDSIQQEKDTAQGVVSSIGTIESAQKRLEEANRRAELSRLLAEQKAEEERKTNEKLVSALEKKEEAQKNLDKLLEDENVTEDIREQARADLEIAISELEQAQAAETEAQKALEEAEKDCEEDEAAATEAQNYLEHIDENYNLYYPKLDQAIEKIQGASEALADAKKKMSEQSRMLLEKQQSTELQDAKAAAANTWIEAQYQLAKAQEQLSKAQEIQADIQADMLLSRSLFERYSQIVRQQEKVKKLASEEEDSIYAQADGIVLSFNKHEGERVADGENVLVLQEIGDACILNCRVTRNQAQYLAVGMKATITGKAVGSFEAFLLSIRADIEDPEFRNLTIAVYGEVQQGDSIKLFFPLSQEEYPLVVQNSAVRTDKNGIFVLVLRTKTSPLGNRYHVERIPIEVLDSDEYNSAIAGNLTENDKIVIAATKPITDNDQVRTIIDE